MSLFLFLKYAFSEAMVNYGKYSSLYRDFFMLYTLEFWKLYEIQKQLSFTDPVTSVIRLQIITYNSVDSLKQLNILQIDLSPITSPILQIITSCFKELIFLSLK